MRLTRKPSAGNNKAASIGAMKQKNFGLGGNNTKLYLPETKKELSDAERNCKCVL